MLPRCSFLQILICYGLKFNEYTQFEGLILTKQRFIKVTLNVPAILWLKMWPVVKSKLSGFTFIYLIFTWNKNLNITQITQTRQIDKTLQYIQIYQIIVIKVISTLLPLLSYILSYEIYMKFVAKLYDSSSLLSTRSRA